MENILTNLLFIAILLRLSYLDIKTKHVPNFYCIAIFILSCLYGNDVPYGQRIVESIFIVIPLIVIWIIRKKGLGAGDIKFIFVCTLLLGVEYILWGLLLGMMIAILINLFRRKEKGIALIPYISLGLIVSMLIK